MTTRLLRLVPALAAVTVSLMVAGVANAAWTATGSGTGQARATSAQALVVTGNQASADLYPGSPAGSLVVTVTNPNPYPVAVSSVSAGAVSAITSSAGSSCSGTGTGLAYSWTTKSTNLGQVVAANGGAFTYTLTGAITMSNASDATCAGASFSVPVSVTGASAAGSPATTPTNATVAVP